MFFFLSGHTDVLRVRKKTVCVALQAQDLWADVYAISVWTLHRWMRVRLCYEFLWLVHPLISCLRTCTNYVAIFTVKQRWLQRGLYLFIIIYLLICMSNSRHGIVLTKMKNYSGTMRMSEVLVWAWILFHGKR